MALAAELCNLLVFGGKSAHLLQRHHAVDIAYEEEAVALSDAGVRLDRRDDVGAALDFREIEAFKPAKACLFNRAAGDGSARDAHFHRIGARVKRGKRAAAARKQPAPDEGDVGNADDGDGDANQ